VPFRAQNKQDPFKGLIRTYLLKEDIRNMEATHLLAKLNRIPLGVFHSGIMTADFTTSSSGSGNPHAEENLIRAMKDVWDDLPWGKGANVLTIKLTKSPCRNCTSEIIRFAEHVEKQGYDLRIRMKVMKLYKEDAAGANLARLRANLPIVIRPWSIEDRFSDDGDDAYLPTKKTMKGGSAVHELAESSFTASEIQKLAKRTSKLSVGAGASLGTKSEYVGIASPLDPLERAKMTEFLKGQITTGQQHLQMVDARILELKTRRSGFDDEIQRSQERYDERSSRRRDRKMTPVMEESLKQQSKFTRKYDPYRDEGVRKRQALPGEVQEIDAELLKLGASRSSWNAHLELLRGDLRKQQQ